MTLPVFTPEERTTAHRLLAGKVAMMMGRKFEEGDWAEVYCIAKSIPCATWSNLSIDITHGHLGVEHKMLCYRSDTSILSACGTVQMHPAGTRSIRIPDEADATKAAHIVMQQYTELLNQRKELIRALDRYHHGAIDRQVAIAQVIELFPGMKQATANRLIPTSQTPVSADYGDRDPDMRTGWLLWQDSLREFLYFEEETVAPDPNNYFAVWQESGGGRRKTSRNLWVYDLETRQKRFSITTTAGAKIQPYFVVPAPDDPNLYHFIVQGEDVGNDLVRLWLTPTTANFLRYLIGSLDTEAVNKAAAKVLETLSAAETPPQSFEAGAIPVVISARLYEQLRMKLKAVSDEHLVQQVVYSLQA